VTTSRLSIPEAIERLFEIKVAKESPYLRNKAMSMVRNGLISTEKDLIVQRSSNYITSDQLPALFNALLLNSVFHDPKDVKMIFEDMTYRQQCAGFLSEIFGKKDSVAGVMLRNSDAVELVRKLESSMDLRMERLPNPFSVLPQLALGRGVSLMHALLAQAASLAPLDSLLMAYLQGDLERANDLASNLEGEDPGILLLKEMISAKLAEAREFDDLLNYFRKK